MYALRLTCPIQDADSISGELWQAGTAGIQELDSELESEETIVLIAFFETDEHRAALLARHARYLPEWEAIARIDWVEETRKAWLPRAVGERLFLAPPWSESPTPEGRTRIVHNPGLACGTGEHPCTQLALGALEKCITPGCRAVDIGTGSGLLAIAAIRLGATSGMGVDLDVAALAVARENFLLNDLKPLLAAGSADCLTNGCSDLTIANISGTVLLSILDDLRRITRENGILILTGFPESELKAFQREFPAAAVTAMDEWRCITARPSSRA